MKTRGENVDSRKRAPQEGRASARPVSHLYRRHPIHLPPLERHNRAIIIFVTLCTAGRQKILASSAAHEAIVAAWALATKYVILPDHVHFFCAPNGFDTPSLEVWMKFWKSIATRTLGEPGGSLRQRDHWDRQLRKGESYDDKWEYVRSNPVRHGLVSEADAWPYQGELNELRW